MNEQEGVYVFTAPPPNPLPVTNVTVWGGKWDSDAEKTMSKLAFDNREQLVRFVHFPKSQRGDVLPRPYYWAGSRRDGTTFPYLKEIGLSNANPMPTLRLWKCPSLETIVFLMYDEKNVFGIFSERDKALKELKLLYPNLHRVRFLKHDPDFKDLDKTLRDVIEEIQI